MIDSANYYDLDNFEEEKNAENLFFLLRGRKPNDADLNEAFFKEKLNAIRYGKLSFLHIERACKEICVNLKL